MVAVVAVGCSTALVVDVLDLLVFERKPAHSKPVLVASVVVFVHKLVHSR